ncbi:hypothetical protein NC651_010508 [Populus alba x Populus x berolinensis]|nr:hypothetical protein NC651_010508 [Populus alba x Populus x berolinensis]
MMSPTQSFFSISAMILILMFMADSISATRIYSSMALPNYSPQSGDLTGKKPVKMREVAFHVSFKGRRMIPPSGPSHRGDRTKPTFN